MNARIDKRYGSIAWKKLRRQILASALGLLEGRGAATKRGRTRSARPPYRVSAICDFTDAGCRHRTWPTGLGTARAACPRHSYGPWLLELYVDGLVWARVGELERVRKRCELAGWASG